MKPFILATVVNILAVVIFNAMIDPYHAIRRDQTAGKMTCGPEEVMVMPDNFDERGFHLERIKHIGKPDVVFMGSSRVMLATAKSFRPEMKVYNTAVSNASIEDLLNTWQAIKEARKIPKKIIIFVDPSLLQKNPKLTSWRKYREPYDRFLAEHEAYSMTWRNRGKDWFASLSVKKDEIKTLLAWTTFVASYSELKFRYQYGQLLRRCVRQDELPEQLSAVQADGSRVYPRKAMLPKSPTELSALFKGFLSDPDYGRYGELIHFNADPEAPKRLALLFEDMRRENVRTMLIIPPYAPTLFARISTRPEFAAVRENYFNAFRRLAATQVNVGFCDAFNPAFGRCVDSDFLDSLHMLRPCVARTLLSCLGERAEWHGLLSATPVQY